MNKAISMVGHSPFFLAVMRIELSFVEVDLKKQSVLGNFLETAVEKKKISLFNRSYSVLGRNSFQVFVNISYRFLKCRF